MVSVELFTLLYDVIPRDMTRTRSVKIVSLTLFVLSLSVVTKTYFTPLYNSICIMNLLHYTSDD